jgi:hypothetical protein
VREKLLKPFDLGILGVVLLVVVNIAGAFAILAAVGGATPRY